MSFDPSDFNDLADLAGVMQRQKMLQRQAQSTTDQGELRAIKNELAKLNATIQAAKKQEQSLPQCPVCGGRLEGEFRKCKHCTADVVWVEGIPCEPGKEEEQVREYRRKVADEAKRKEEEETRKEMERQESLTNCKRCGRTMEKSTASWTGGLCKPCHRKGCLGAVLFMLTLLPVLLIVLLFFF
jgi:ATP-dependent Clp protease ATP-binding subunit ClpA